jgi:anti-sigma factor RsiW
MRIVGKKKEASHLTKLEISYLLDGEMLASDAKIARRHLDNCGKCCAMGRRFKRADKLFRESKEKHGH